MPKLVDHAERQEQIVRAVWRIVVDRGAEAATMREIAREAGFANGALTHYFRDKDDVLRSAYEHAFGATDERVAAATGALRGLAAVRAFAVEVLPLDEGRVDEASVALAAWSRLGSRPDLAELHADLVRAWTSRLLTWLAQAREAGEVRSPAPDEVLADRLLQQLMGAQVLVQTSAALSARRLTAALDDALRTLR